MYYSSMFSYPLLPKKSPVSQTKHFGTLKLLKFATSREQNGNISQTVLAYKMGRKENTGS